MVLKKTYYIISEYTGKKEMTLNFQTITLYDKTKIKIPTDGIKLVIESYEDVDTYFYLEKDIDVESCNNVLKCEGMGDKCIKVPVSKLNKFLFDLTEKVESLKGRKIIKKLYRGEIPEEIPVKYREKVAEGLIKKGFEIRDEGTEVEVRTGGLGVGKTFRRIGETKKVAYFRILDSRDFHDHDIVVIEEEDGITVARSKKFKGHEVVGEITRGQYDSFESAVEEFENQPKKYKRI